MKIGIFTDSYTPQTNGLASATQTTAYALRKKGHEISVIAPSYPRYKDKEPNVYRLASIEFFTPEARFALQLPQRSLLKLLREDFDIIHGHNGGPVSFLGWEIARAKGIPFVLTYHTMLNKYTHYILNGKVITPKMAEFVSKIICNNCDQLIVPTARVKKEVLSYGVKKEAFVLPTGVDISAYQDFSKGYLRKKFKISNQTKILLYVGRLGKEKSVSFLLESFAEMRKQASNIKLVLIGSGSEKSELIKQCAKLQITEDVIFLGTISHRNIPKAYADADVFVFASQSETQGMVILEALASGIPVVAVNDDAYSGIVKNGENGYLLKKDANIFATHVISLLENSELYQSLSDGAKKTAEKFSIEQTVSKLETLYTQQLKLNENKFGGRKRTIRTIKEFKNFLDKTRSQFNLFERF